MFRWSDTISSWAEQFSGPRAAHQHRTDKIEIHHLTHFRFSDDGRAGGNSGGKESDCKQKKEEAHKVFIGFDIFQLTLAWC